MREGGATPPAQPLLFAKPPSRVIGTEQPIVVDSRITERVGWEVKLAVVSRRPRTLR